MRTLFVLLLVLVGISSAQAGVLTDMHAAGKEHGAVLDNGTFPLPIWVSADADSVTVDRRIDGLIVWYLVSDPDKDDELQAPPICRLRDTITDNFDGHVDIYTKIRSGNEDVKNSRIVFIRQSGTPREFLDVVELALNSVFPETASVREEKQ
jgi:hypothetical protein